MHAERCDDRSTTHGSAGRATGGEFRCAAGASTVSDSSGGEDSLHDADAGWCCTGWVAAVSVGVLAARHYEAAHHNELAGPPVRGGDSARNITGGSEEPSDQAVHDALRSAPSSARKLAGGSESGVPYTGLNARVLPPWTAHNVPSSVASGTSIPLPNDA